MWWTAYPGLAGSSERGTNSQRGESDFFLPPREPTCLHNILPVCRLERDFPLPTLFFARFRLVASVVDISLTARIKFLLPNVAFSLSLSLGLSLSLSCARALSRSLARWLCILFSRIYMQSQGCEVSCTDSGENEKRFVLGCV